MREQGNEIELEAVRVLELVHHEVMETVAPFVARLGKLAQEPDGEQQEVVEIDGVHALEFGLVTVEDCAEQGVVLRHAAGRDAGIVLEFGDVGLRGVGVEFFVLRGGARDDGADRPEAVALIVDGKIRFPAEAFDVRAQDAHAQGVEGGDGQFFRGGVIVEHPDGALAHFARQPCW